MEEETDSKVFPKRAKLLDCDSEVLFHSTLFDKTSRNKGYDRTELQDFTNRLIPELFRDNNSHKLNKDTGKISSIFEREA